MSLLFTYKHLWCLLVIWWGIGFAALGQNPKKKKNEEKTYEPAQTHRAEIESDSYEEDHWVHPLPDTSLLVISQQNKSWFSKEKFKLSRYNRKLEQIWQTEHEQPESSQLISVTSEDSLTFLLFSVNRDSRKLILFQVSITTGHATHSEHKLPNSNLHIREVAASKGKLFLSALDNAKLTMLLLNPVEEECRHLPAVFGQEEDLADFRVDTLTHAAEFVVVESYGFRSRIQVRRLFPNSDSAGTYFIPPRLDYRNDNHLQNARLTPGDTLHKRLLGTYGYRNGVYASGLFSSDLAGNTKYFDFGQLNHFFDYMSERRQRKLKEKVARNEAKGKTATVKYRLLLHPLQPHPQGYAMVGEVYTPLYSNSPYRTNNYYRYDPSFDAMRYPNLIPTARNGPQSYRYSHALICVFDPEGNLLWDNNYKLKDQTTSSLAPSVETGVTADGRVALAYPDEEKIYYKVVQPNTTHPNDDYLTVRAQTEEERVTETNHEGITHWYGSHFIAHGFQRIRPQEGKSRSVFYLQEIEF